ncbi:G-protein beta WD- 40 repeats containing protein [Penicillium brevicompactum]|uniref:G-protein beta WD- 40 repeats containing protein n=1 Tax=Penicillium brevicompactum TaxID=5074 RepID=UPI00254003DF|nr:G-protein beta WD- 40 repeats containing protein [Penicillium brevicompactum]KAJ5337057.1 G-protein beta WD- 40 repeats containing protein [Penicillium brevicompactum]
MLVYRPLKLEEIRSVTGLTDQEDAIELLVDQCASFIKLHENKIEFVHKSARDFLAGKYAQSVFFSGEHFGPDEIALGCLSYLSERLTANLVELTRPDSTPKSLKGLKDERDNVLLARVDYAATFWVQHLEDTKKPLVPQTNLALIDTVIIFLQTKFLEWLECVSLLGKLPQTMEALKTLANLAKDHSCLSSLVQDATRFLSRHYHTIANWPLQIYSSAIIFSPESSIVKTKSMNKIPIWLRKPPKMEENWSSLVQTLKNDRASVNTVAFSLNGKYIASGSDDDTVKLWDSTTGDVYRSLESHSSRKTLIGHIGPVTAVAFSADGQQIASGSDDTTIKLWNPRTGDLEKCLSGHSSQITAISFSSDGKQIVSGAHDHTIKIWDTATANVQKTLVGHSGPVTALAISLDGKLLAFGSFDKTTKLWDTATTELQQTLGGHSDWVNSVAFTPDSKQIISGSSDETIKLWNTTMVNLQKPLAHHSGAVTAMAFSLDGKNIISGEDSTLKLWDAITGDLQKTLIGHSKSVTDVAFSPDGTEVVSSAFENDIKLWDIRTGSHQTLVGHSDWVNTVKFSPNGNQIASGARDNTIKLWDSTTGTLQGTLEGHYHPVTAMAFSSEGDKLASSSSSAIRLWDVTKSPQGSKHFGRTFRSLLTSRSCQEIKEIKTSENIYTIKFSSDDRCLATNIGRISLEDLPRGGRSIATDSTTEPLGEIHVRNQGICHEEIPFLRLPSDLVSQCCIVQGDQVAIGFQNGQVLLFEIDRSRLRSMLDNDPDGFTIVMSCDLAVYNY